MNKKITNIILIVLLLIIWGSVIYKFFGKNKKADPFLITNSPVLKLNSNYNIAKDTFKLNLSYRDPFKTSKRKSNFVNNFITYSKKRAVNKTKKSKLIWPRIEYFGFVKGKRNSTKLAIIKVNNKLYRKRESQKINEIIIKRVYGDSIIILLANEEKKIKRKKDI